MSLREYCPLKRTWVIDFVSQNEDFMKEIDYSKKYGIPEAQLESILEMFKKSDQSLSNEREYISPRVFTINRKVHKKKLSKVIKKLSGKPNPWNKDEIKISPWIYKK